jgi:hypothetical protein
MRPPQQNPVIAIRLASPPFLAAHCADASRSDITCASGTCANNLADLLDLEVRGISWRAKRSTRPPCSPLREAAADILEVFVQGPDLVDD